MSNKEKLKISILFNFHYNQPWGGSNAFLKVLKRKLMENNYYENEIRNADCILINPYNYKTFLEALKAKFKYPEKIFILRIDGPLYLYRGNSEHIDSKIYEIYNLIADGIIFQSKWSKAKNLQTGLKIDSFNTLIFNASDDIIFYPEKKKIPDFNKNKCKLVAVSFSSNYNKGFPLYRYLDNHLDFNKYSMLFIGNSPIKFKNIRHIQPIIASKLANLLRNRDIYITGSKADPCSNALIEALNCGLPSLVYNDGGHPELVKNGGETFNTFEECIQKLNLIRTNYQKYKNNISIPNLDQTLFKYVKFISRIYNLKKKGKYTPKRILIYHIFKFLFGNNKNRVKLMLKLLFFEFYRTIKKFRDKMNYMSSNK